MTTSTYKYAVALLGSSCRADQTSAENVNDGIKGHYSTCHPSDFWNVEATVTQLDGRLLNDDELRP